jgi:alkaline phosphatase D
VKGVLDQAELVYYRVSFLDRNRPRLASEPFIGTLRPISSEPKRLRFCFGGDTAGQGWGINPEFGGMTIYAAILERQPDFFVHCGDMIYADGPIQSEVTLDDGRIWKNIVTPAKSKVAETLDEFRGNYQYNLLDENIRKFNATIPQLVQWDDHETLNNWYPQEILDDSRYSEKSGAVLASRARQAFFEYTPISPEWTNQDRIHRSYRYGSLLEIFMIDLRSYRGPNSPNRQEERSPATDFLGEAQLAWLKRSLAASKATWKVISSDMPLGLVVGDGPTAFEGLANGDGPALGRELEIADLLKFIKDQKIGNIVWITADVHYAAAHYYDPAKAQFKDFKPFWEFVSGPLHAGTFGPNALDNTFGPEVRWKGIPDDLKPNRSPWDGYQFFGEIEVEAQSKTMTVRQFNLKSEKVFELQLRPEES